MGGTAIPNARRMWAEDYEVLSHTILSLINARFPGLDVTRLVSYEAKSDFGNLSLVVTKQDPETMKQVRKFLLFELDTGETLTTGEHIAIEYRGAQVDFDFVSEEDAAMFIAYHAYNGLGGIIGKVARSLGLVLRPTELVYRLKDGFRLIEDVVVADTWSDTLTKLGYDASRWQQGFKTPEDIFAYVVSSPFFKFEFVMDELMEDAKYRSTLAQEFVEYLRTAPMAPNQPEHSKAPEAVLQRLFTAIPGFESLYLAAVERGQQAQARSQAVRALYNGSLVSEWTGRRGYELGVLLRRVEEGFGSKGALEDWVLASDADTVRQKVLDTAAMPA
jgi:hypothetical protein